MPSIGTMYDSITHDATLTRAAEATAKLMDEIDQLWCDSVVAHDVVATDRLVAASHAIHRAFHLLDEGPVIG